ncbi:MAG: transposase [Pyrinomonadaceae bacterium]
MNTATLLADPEAILLDCIHPSLETITLVIQTATANKRVKSIRPPSIRLPSPHHAAWMLLQPVKLNDEQPSTMEKLWQLFPQIEKAKGLAQEFTRIMRERSSNKFNEWLRAAMKSTLKEFESFARGLIEDYEAVKNALRCKWSNGQLEGQVNRLKLIKRMMYGRAKFDLLRGRVLHST